MYPPKTVIHFQWVLLVASAVLGLSCFLIYRPLAQQVADLDPQLAALWDHIFDINLRNKARLGMDLPALMESQRLVEKSVELVRQAGQQLKQRVELEPEVRELLHQPFQLLDYDQQRLQLISDLRRLAAERGANVDPSVISGYPEYLMGNERPVLLWTQLSLFHHIVTSAISQGPAHLKSAVLLPGKTFPAVEGDKGAWDEIPVRLELTANMETALKILMSMPLRGDEMKARNLNEFSAARPSLFLNHLILKSTTNANEVSLEAVVSGWVNQELLP